MAAGDILPQPEVCGHCHEAKNVEMQGQHLFCFDCGKVSNLDGTPVHGNAHYRANYSTTLPEANRHGITDF